MTWNGTTITGPELIYVDEILANTTEIGDPNRPGALICRSDYSGRVSWHFPSGITVTPHNSSNATFRQIRTQEGVLPSLSRLTPSREGVVDTRADANGVWHCRLNAVGVSGYDGQINVGIFSRGGGELLRGCVLE